MRPACGSTQPAIAAAHRYLDIPPNTQVPGAARLHQAILTMAILTMAILTMAILTIAIPTRFLVQLGYITEITETLLLALGDFYAKMLASVVLMQVCIYIQMSALLPSYPPYGTFIVLMQAPFMTCAFCLAQSPPPRGRSPTYPPTYQPTCSCRVPPRAPTRTSGASCVNCSTRRRRALSRTLSTDPDPNPSLALASWP